MTDILHFFIKPVLLTQLNQAVITWELNEQLITDGSDGEKFDDGLHLAYVLENSVMSAIYAKVQNYLDDNNLNYSVDDSTLESVTLSHNRLENDYHTFTTFQEFLSHFT
jgi:hypothetical protein